MIDTIGAAIFGFEGANVLVALRARVLIELERARFEEFVGLRARDLMRGQRDGHRGKRRRAMRLGFPRHSKSSIGPLW